MMEDLLDNNQLDEIRNKLLQHQFIKIVFDSRENIVQADFFYQKESYRLLCVLEKYFPYRIPYVFLDSESYEKIKDLPHINNDRSICAFDREKVIPNIKEPTELIVAALDLARETIENGLNGQNKTDFIDEIHAYWNLKVKGDIVVESILCKDDIPREIAAVYDSKIHKIYVADNASILQDYLSNLDKKSLLDKFISALYLPLDLWSLSSIPLTDLSFLYLIKKNPSSFPVYNMFIQKYLQKGAIVILSFGKASKRVLLAYKHSPVSMKQKGFRRGHIPVNIAYARISTKKRPILMDVIDMSQEYLYTRGGVGLNEIINDVCVLGCGSVGSHIIQALKDCGTSHFTIIDTDTLLPENIARHYCGYESIGLKKVDAIKLKLARENPNVICDCFTIDGYDYLNHQLKNINRMRYMFLAVADYPLEYKTIDYITEKKITIPVIIFWVEPHMVGAHAVIISHPQSENLYDFLFDEYFAFKYRVLNNMAQYYKKETGCGSTYMPYSVLPLKECICSFLNYMENVYIKQNKTGNYVWSWLGNITQVKESYNDINPIWKNCDEHQYYVHRID